MLEDIFHVQVMKHVQLMEIVVSNLYSDLNLCFIFYYLELYGSYGSSILSPSENSYLTSITKSRRTSLLYKATIHGFDGSSFHSRCDGKANTVTIIKTDSNYVFGGYTAAAWKNDGSYSRDSTAFIFSLRRNGSTYSEKFHVQRETTAIFNKGDGFAFGSYEASFYCDINIQSSSNFNVTNYADFGASYHLPSGYKYGESNTRSYLAGRYLGWLTTEIEVFQIL
jgi:hypothetical protein